MISPAPNRIALLALMFVGLWGSQARSQDYSPNNKVYSIRPLTGERAVFHVSFNALKETLAIRYANDTVRVRSVLALDTVQVLGDAFLRIAYRVHAGVGVHVTRTLWLSARDQRICPSLSFTSDFTEDFMDFRRSRTSPKQVEVKTRYAVDLSLRKQSGIAIPDFQAVAAVRGKQESLLEPQRNYQYNRRAALTFDPKQHIFYGAQEYVSRRFQVFDPKANSETTQNVKGTFPVLTLGEYKYVYLEGAWYEMQRTELTKYTY